MSGGSGAGDSQSVIKLGGGTDLSRSQGQQRQGEEAEYPRPGRLEDH